MTPPTIIIIKTGIANTASIRVSFQRLGLMTEVTNDGDTIRRAEYLVLPGVGSFAAGARCLDELGIRDFLCKRIETDRPTLAICLGMQLLARGSEESRESKGLGILPVSVTRFGDERPVPQMGWNDIALSVETRFLRSGCAYFANSFAITEEVPGWVTASSKYGKNFISAVERGCVMGCQFHPELSGRWGLDLLARWVGIMNVKNDSAKLEEKEPC